MREKKKNKKHTTVLEIQTENSVIDILIKRFLVDFFLSSRLESVPSTLETNKISCVKNYSSLLFQKHASGE